MRLWGAVALALAILLSARVAGADDFGTALAGLSRDSSDDVAAAVQALGATGDPRALRVLVALRDGDVTVDEAGGVYLRDKDGLVRDAVSGAPSSGRGHSPTVDNAVRRVLEPIIARLGLTSSDPEQRLDAVAELARRASEEDAPALRGALAREKIRSVRRAILSALAETDLASNDPQRRLAAVRAIDEAGSLNLTRKVEGLLAVGPDGKPTEPDARVREAAQWTLGHLHRKQTLVDRTADVLYGMSTGSILLLSALGLAITFGLMGVINMAHGEMLMLGAYATYATQTFFHDHLPAHESLYLAAAVPVALLSCMAVGALLERTVIRFLYGRPLETLLATYGLSLLLIQVVRSTFGAQNVEVRNPPWLSGGTEISRMWSSPTTVWPSCSSRSSSSGSSRSCCGERRLVYGSGR